MVYRENLSTLKRQRGGGDAVSSLIKWGKRLPTSDDNTDKSRTNLSVGEDEDIPSPPENFEEVADERRPVSDITTQQYRDEADRLRAKSRKDNSSSYVDYVESLEDKRKNGDLAAQQVISELKPKNSDGEDDLSTLENARKHFDTWDSEEKKGAYDELEIFKSYWKWYISQIFGDEEIHKLISKIDLPNYKKRTEYEFYNTDDNPTFRNGVHWLLYHKNLLDKGEDGEQLKLKPESKKLLEEHPEYRICSVDDQGYQNIHFNTQDVLCQSYATLNKFSALDEFEDMSTTHNAASRALKKNPKSQAPSVLEAEKQQFEIQKTMIRFYRDLLNFIELPENKKLQADFKKIINDQKELWKTKEVDKKTKKVYDNVEGKGGVGKPISKQSANTIIKILKETLDEWDKYGWVWFIHDPQLRLTGVKTEEYKGGGDTIDVSYMIPRKKSRKRSNKKSDKKSRKRTSKKD